MDGLLLTIAIILSLALWIIGLVLLIKYWKQLPTAVQVLGIIFLIPGIPLGAVVTIVLVLCFK